VKKAKDRMESIAGGEGHIAWCGGLLWVQIAAKLLWSLDPFSLLTLRRWHNLLCDGLSHYSVHVVRRSDCIRVSATTTAPVH
jgi:hypothetical protein